MSSAKDIAKYIVNKCTEEGCPISNLQLQKILYYIQRQFLQINKEAFEDDIEAWQFGPVVPSVYYMYCGFGANPIRWTYDEKFEFEDDDKFLVNAIIDQKRALNPWDMVRDTHGVNKAWYIVYKNGMGDHSIIPKQLIRDRG